MSLRRLKIELKPMEESMGIKKMKHKRFSAYSQDKTTTSRQDKLTSKLDGLAGDTLSAPGAAYCPHLSQHSDWS